jgi:hypothetical protein
MSAMSFTAAKAELRRPASRTASAAHLS